jgi:A/G-specific adenine glycosylase
MKHLESLRSWFKTSRRDLPWRSSQRDPYHVWISEVMLQQTQASVVIPYYHRWIEAFPTLHHLAKASIDQVLKLWEGLGYYSRARSLHKGAQIIVSEHQGVFPKNREAIAALPGIGPYTTGAILSFAFGQVAPAVDGNVLRVLGRYLALELDISAPSTRKYLEAYLQEVLPSNQPEEISEALIELGALICTKQQPQCVQCPLQKSCKAYQQDQISQYPIKNSKISYTKLYRVLLVLQLSDGSLLIREPPTKGLMSGLAEFPYLDLSEEACSELEQNHLEPLNPQSLFHSVLHLALKLPRDTLLKESLCSIKKLKNVNQSFTRYRVTLYPYLIRLSLPLLELIPEFYWLSPNELKKMPFSSGHRKVLQEVIHHQSLQGD